MKKKIKTPATYEIWSLYRSQIMGLSIISVILFHFIKDYATDDVVLPYAADIFYKYFGSCGVDIFLFLSGFGLYYSMKQKEEEFNLLQFYVSKLSRIIIPYLLIALPSLIYRNIVVRAEDWSMVWKDLFFVSFFDEGESWYWYIFMACICYLIFPYLYSIVDSSKTAGEENSHFLSLFSFVTLISLLLQLYEPDLFGNINGALLRFFPFILGTFVGKKSYEKRPLCWLHYLGVLQIFVTYPLTESTNAIIMRYMLAINGIMICFLICRIFYCTRNLKFHPLRGILGFIGNYTLELYLTHVMLRVIMTSVGYKPNTIYMEAIMLLFAIDLTAMVRVLSSGIMKLFHIR